MQQFVVPQFIDVENKIFGPITTRQFLILLVAGILVFLAFRFGDFSLFLTTLILVGGGAIVISFVKVNGQHFHVFLLNILMTMRKPSLRIWNKVYTNEELDYLRKLALIETVVEEKVRKTAKHAHIRDLSLIVNTGGYYKPDESDWAMG